MEIKCYRSDWLLICIRKCWFKSVFSKLFLNRTPPGDKHFSYIQRKSFVSTYGWVLALSLIVSSADWLYFNSTVASGGTVLPPPCSEVLSNVQQKCFQSRATEHMYSIQTKFQPEVELFNSVLCCMWAHLLNINNCFKQQHRVHSNAVLKRALLESQ